MNLISATYARNNLSRLLDDVVQKGKQFVLLRDSQPQAVLIPYQDLLAKKEAWQEEFTRLAKKTRPSFKKWLAKKGLSINKLSEEKVYELVNQAAGRS
ncbi:type II toxin-antitoxin system Phd/YefM family antitoxin [Patescibacteria group bacterium]